MEFSPPCTNVVVAALKKQTNICSLDLDIIIPIYIGNENLIVLTNEISDDTIY